MNLAKIAALIAALSVAVVYLSVSLVADLPRLLALFSGGCCDENMGCKVW